MHDVAVIGGGPAGATAGALLGAAGRDVAILEMATFPRFQIGESLLPWNTRIFDRLGLTPALRDAFIEKWGVTFVTSSGEMERTFHFDRALDPRYPMAFQVQRAAFDGMLLEAAAGKGARVAQGVRVSAARREGGRWLLDLEPAGGGPRRLEARYLIDASGRKAFMASRSGRRHMDGRHRKASLFAHFKGVPRAEGKDAGNIVIVTLRDGWIWFIPFADGTTSVGLVADGTALREAGRTPEGCFDEALRRCPAARWRTRRAERVTEVMGASDWTYTCAGISGEGYLTAGDAAAFLDPIFSSGVLLAMRSGEAAADLLDETLRRGRPDPRRWRGYERLLLRQVSAYRRMVDLFYTPGFAALTFHPSSRFNLGGAVMSLLAGHVDHGWSVRWRLELFYALGAVLTRLGVGPQVDLHRVFAEEIDAAPQGAGAA